MENQEKGFPFCLTKYFFLFFLHPFDSEKLYELCSVGFLPLSQNVLAVISLIKIANEILMCLLSQRIRLRAPAVTYPGREEFNKTL